MDFDSRLK